MQQLHAKSLSLDSETLIIHWSTPLFTDAHSLWESLEWFLSLCEWRLCDARPVRALKQRCSAGPLLLLHSLPTFTLLQVNKQLNYCNASSGIRMLPHYYLLRCYLWLIDWWRHWGQGQISSSRTLETDNGDSVWCLINTSDLTSCCLFYHISCLCAVQSHRSWQHVQPGHNACDGWRHRNVWWRLRKVQLAGKKGLSLSVCPTY